MSKEWKVVWQETPYNYTHPHVLVIEADSGEDAGLTATDWLTRHGYAVGQGTNIRSVEEYTLRPKGRVVEAE